MLQNQRWQGRQHIDSVVFHELVRRQGDFFHTGRTQQIQYRLDSLRKLREAILSREDNIYTALKSDLGKSKFESYAGEIGVVLSEISEAIKHIRRWSKPKKVKSRLINFPDRNFIYLQPYGTTLIIGPWNYPFQLTLAPLIAAISAGNCAILKPSEIAPGTSRIVSEIVGSVFHDDHVAIIEGGIEVSQALLQQKFDFIFFTGGTKVGRIVMKAAAEHLTPVVLELGGKNPAIVDSDANIDVAAKRIAWGKFFNAGQTCVAPDYLLVNSEIAMKFTDALIRTLQRFYGKDPRRSPDYSRIVNGTHFDRLKAFLAEGRIIVGGEFDKYEKYIAPTIIADIGWDNQIMQEEIFGPILPVLEFDDLDTVIEEISKRPSPLSLYYFSSNRKQYEKIISRLRFGGGCFNDCVMHLLNPNLPFGGIGESGIGHYHGKSGFDTFSHCKAVLKKGTWLDISLRYPPYVGKLKWIKKILK